MDQSAEIIILPRSVWSEAIRELRLGARRKVGLERLMNNIADTLHKEAIEPHKD